MLELECVSDPQLRQSGGAVSAVCERIGTCGAQQHTVGGLDRLDIDLVELRERLIWPAGAYERVAEHDSELGVVIKLDSGAQRIDRGRELLVRMLERAEDGVRM